MSSKYLLLLDTDKIKNYITSSGKLKELIGASALLEYLNIVRTREVLEQTTSSYKIIYLDGGSGKIEFEAKQEAEACGRKVEQLYISFTETSTISWEVVEIPEHYHAQGYFYSDFIAEGEFRLKMKKQQGGALGQPKMLALHKRCEHCGTEPVTTKAEFSHLSWVRDKPGRNLAVCSSCFIKRSFTEEIRIRLSQTYENISEEEKPLRLKMEERLMKNQEVEWPQQLPVVAKYCAKGHIGLLYFDGNSINAALRKITDSDDLQHFSAVLRDAIHSSVLETTEALFDINDLKPVNNADGETGEKNETKVLPIEFVMTAGDDLIVITPGSKAMEFSSLFQTAFSSKMEKADYGVTMSAGVVISKPQFPIKYLLPLGEQLLKNAKKKNYLVKDQTALTSSEKSTIDYMVVSMSSNPNLEQIREEQLKEKTERPVSLGQWQEMHKVIQKMKTDKESIPRSKMKTLYHLHFLENWEANFLFQKYTSSLSLSQRENLKYLYGIFTEQGADLTSLRYSNEDDEVSGPLIDTFEIYDFVETEDAL